MVFIAEAFFSGCISKVINDSKDCSWAKIKKVINDKNNSNLSTKIYRVIENTLNTATNKKFKGTDALYEAIERIFTEFRNNGSTIESVKSGFEVLNSNVSIERCQNFLEKFYEGVCQDDNLYKVISLILQEKEIQINQEKFKQLNETVERGYTELNRKSDKEISTNNKKRNVNSLQNKKSIKSRTHEYADKWNDNMFLNNFDKRDENAGVNVKLGEVYLDEHLPQYTFMKNENSSNDLKELLSEYIYMHNKNKMLLILGQPGIGKSTLITWITASFINDIDYILNDNILVYKFASDLKGIDWQSEKISNVILEKLGLEFSDLNEKTLILDGFDEVSIENDRRDLLNCLYGELIYKENINGFSLIITSRENCIQELEQLRCKYITLQPWDEMQIKSFCTVFQKKTNNNISESTIKKVIENKEVLGIPLILYMVLALNISIDKEGSIVDVYDKIFSLKGGIYDRCIDNKKFGDDHRIGVIKNQIHQISREIAIWMFENNADEAYIVQEEYKKICETVKSIEDFKIGSFFKAVRHCEGIETEHLYFVHRSIYEYFVAETIYSSVENALLELDEISKEKLAGNIAVFLKKGWINYTIREYLKYKIEILYNKLEKEKKEKFYQWWESAIDKMMQVGMFYYTEENINKYNNIIQKELTCFLNLLEILRLLSEIENREYIFKNSKLVEYYIRHCCIDFENDKIKSKSLDFSKMFLKDVNLGRIDLHSCDLTKTNLEGANLEGANLEGANLAGANLTKADLRKADLRRAILRNTDLQEIKASRIELYEARLENSIWHISALKYIHSQLNHTTFRHIIITSKNSRKTVNRGEILSRDFDEFINWISNELGI